MTKYRIVSRRNSIYFKKKYYAQHKLFNLFWVDVDPDYFDLRDGRESMSMSSNIEDVERYIEDLMSGRQKPDLSTQVVKTYE